MSAHCVMVQLTESVMWAVSTQCIMFQLPESVVRAVLTHSVIFQLPDSCEGSVNSLCHCVMFQLAESVVWAVSTHCVNLETLDMCSLEFVDDSLLLSLAQNCHKLTDVNFRGCRQVSICGNQ